MNNKCISTVLQNLTNINKILSTNINFDINNIPPFSAKQANITLKELYKSYNGNSNYLTPDDVNEILNTYLENDTSLSSMYKTYYFNTLDFFTNLPITYLSNLYTANTHVSSFSWNYLGIQYRTEISTVQEMLENHEQKITNLENLSKSTTKKTINYYISYLSGTDSQEIHNNNKQGTSKNYPFKTLEYCINTEINSNSYTTNTKIYINILDNLIVKEPIIFKHKDITTDSNSQIFLKSEHNSNILINHLTENKSHIIVFQPTSNINNEHISLFEIYTPLTIENLSFYIDYSNITNNIKSTCIKILSNINVLLQNIYIMNFSYCGIYVSNYGVCKCNNLLHINMLGANQTNNLNSCVDLWNNISLFQNIYNQEYKNQKSANPNYLYSNIKNNVLQVLPSNQFIIKFLPNYNQLITLFKNQYNSCSNKTYSEIFNFLNENLQYISLSFSHRSISQALFLNNAHKLIYNIIFPRIIKIKYQQNNNLKDIIKNQIPALSLTDAEINNINIDDITNYYNNIQRENFKLISTQIITWKNDSILSTYVDKTFNTSSTDYELWKIEYTKMKLAYDYTNGYLSTNTLLGQRPYGQYRGQCEPSDHTGAKISGYSDNNFQLMSTQLTGFYTNRPIFNNFNDNLKYAYGMTCLYNQYDMFYNTTNTLYIRNNIIPECFSNNTFKDFKFPGIQIYSAEPDDFYINYATANYMKQKNISINSPLRTRLIGYIAQAKLILLKYGKNFLLNKISSTFIYNHPIDYYTMFTYAGDNISQLTTNNQIVLAYAKRKLIIEQILLSFNSYTSSNIDIIIQNLYKNDKENELYRDYANFMHEMYQEYTWTQLVKKANNNQLDITILNIPHQATNFLKKANNSDYTYGIYVEQYSQYLFIKYSKALNYLKNINIRNKYCK